MGYWAQSTRPTHRAYHTMVLVEDVIVVYGGLSPFCYEYCKDAWTFNITKGEWQSDIYARLETKWESPNTMYDTGRGQNVDPTGEHPLYPTVMQDPVNGERSAQ